MAPEKTGFDGVVLVDGCRIPFQKAGTGYAELRAYDLARSAVGVLLERMGLAPARLDRVILGSVIQDVETSNLAREAALAAGVPPEVPAFTVTMACISGNLAVAAGADAIRTGQARLVLAGGAESLSNVPVQFSRPFRRRLLEARRGGGPADYLSLLKSLRPSDLRPETPAIAEFSTGETMGESADRLAAAFGVTRQEQDAYALASHRRAAAARDAGRLAEDLLPASLPPDFDPITRDNCIRDDSTPEKLAALAPAFVKPLGTVTAGNASPLTDGASAVLLSDPATAADLGREPLVRIGPHALVGQDPGEELLLGPAYAIPRVLDAAGLTLGEVDVFEFHEAFAGQVLAVLHALESSRFAAEKLGRAGPVGEVPLERLNAWGGSLSMGHPFGATGARLVTTAARRLRVEDGRFALVSSCAAGGLGHALLLERWEDRP